MSATDENLGTRDVEQAAPALVGPVAAPPLGLSMLGTPDAGTCTDGICNLP